MVEILEYSPEYEPWFCFVDNEGFSGFDSPYRNETPTERYPESYVQTLLAKADNLIVGYISLSSECTFGMDWNGHRFIEINGLAVLPPYRKQGIGRKLLGEAVSWGKAQGYEKLYAFITSSARSDLHRFYESAGFRLESTQIGLKIPGNKEPVQMPAKRYWNYQQGMERQKPHDPTPLPHNHLPPHTINWVGFVYCLNLVDDKTQLDLI